MYSRKIRKSRTHTKKYLKKHSRKNKKHKKNRITHNKKLHKGGNQVMGTVNNLVGQLTNSKPARVFRVAAKASQIVADAAGPIEKK